MVPRHNRDTDRPERPRWVYSMPSSLPHHRPPGHPRFSRSGTGFHSGRAGAAPATSIHSGRVGTAGRGWSPRAAAGARPPLGTPGSPGRRPGPASRPGARPRTGSCRRTDRTTARSARPGSPVRLDRPVRLIRLAGVRPRAGSDEFCRRTARVRLRCGTVGRVGVPVAGIRPSRFSDPARSGGFPAGDGSTGLPPDHQFAPRLPVIARAPTHLKSISPADAADASDRSTQQDSSTAERRSL